MRTKRCRIWRLDLTCSLMRSCLRQSQMTANTLKPQLCTAHPLTVPRTFPDCHSSPTSKGYQQCLHRSLLLLLLICLIFPLKVWSFCFQTACYPERILMSSALKRFLETVQLLSTVFQHCGSALDQHIQADKADHVQVCMWFCCNTDYACACRLQLSIDCVIHELSPLFLLQLESVTW